DLVDPCHVEGGVVGLAPDRVGGLFRDYAEFGERVRRMGLDLEPDLEARLRRPDRGHLGTAVAGDHQCLRMSFRGTRTDLGRAKWFFPPRFSRSGERRPPARVLWWVENRPLPAHVIDVPQNRPFDRL